jgi:hypothetical protein
VERTLCRLYAVAEGMWLNQKCFFQNYRLHPFNDAFYTCLQKTAFPLGFYVVFVVKGDDWDCSGSYETVTVARNKSVKFSLQPSITYRSYIISTVGAFLVFMLFYVFSIVVSVVYFIKWVRASHCHGGHRLLGEFSLTDTKNKNKIAFSIFKP